MAPGDLCPLYATWRAYALCLCYLAASGVAGDASRGWCAMRLRVQCTLVRSCQVMLLVDPVRCVCCALAALVSQPLWLSPQGVGAVALALRAGIPPPAQPVAHAAAAVSSVILTEFVASVYWWWTLALGSLVLLWLGSLCSWHFYCFLVVLFLAGRLEGSLLGWHWCV